MRKEAVRQATNVVALIAVITVNALANALPLNGQTTGEISDRFDVYFVPAGYVFSIWGLIYLGLIAFAIYQALPGQRDNPHLRRVGYLFVLSCAANVAWLFLWHYEFFRLTVVAMSALLLLLIAIYLRLGIGRTPVSRAEKWFVRVPFSIYLGWVTVATISNVSTVLEYLNWGGWGISPETWTLTMLLVAAGITAVVVFTRRDVAYALVAVWAFGGIAVKHARSPIVAVAAGSVAALSLLLAAVPAWQRRQRPPSPGGTV